MALKTKECRNESDILAVHNYEGHCMCESKKLEIVETIHTVIHTYTTTYYVLHT